MAPTEPEDEVEELLNAVVSLSEQSALLRSIGETMIRLSGDVGVAVGGQMASALRAIP